MRSSLPWTAFSSIANTARFFSPIPVSETFEHALNAENGGEQQRGRSITGNHDQALLDKGGFTLIVLIDRWDSQHFF